jgi:hypothetical protein
MQEAFCSNCGAPQLRYQMEQEGPDSAAADAGAASRDLQWKQAIGAAVTFAVPVGLLCSSIIPILSDGCCLWVVIGGVGAVGLYQRRSATRLLPRPAGVRIGVIIGILAALVAAIVNAASMVVERYMMHGGEAMDKLFEASMKQGSDTFATQLAQASPEQAAWANHFWAFWNSPDGRAAATLLTAGVSSVGIILFSMIGGALGSRIFSRRNASLRSS